MKDNYNKSLYKYIEEIKKSFKIENKNKNDNNDKKEDNKKLLINSGNDEIINYEEIIKVIKTIPFIPKNKYFSIKSLIDEMLDNFFVYKNYTKENILTILKTLKIKIEDLIEDKIEIIMQENKNFSDFRKEAEKLKKEFIQNFNVNFEHINSWIEPKSFIIINKEILLACGKNKEIIPKDFIKLFNLYKMDNESKYKLKEKESPKIKMWDEDNFENYFEIKDDDGFTIKKKIHLLN